MCGCVCVRKETPIELFWQRLTNTGSRQDIATSCLNIVCVFGGVHACGSVCEHIQHRESTKPCHPISTYTLRLWWCARVWVCMCAYTIQGAYETLPLHIYIKFWASLILCMYVCTCVRINVCACACVRARACACVSVHTCLFAYVYMCVFGLCVICVFGGVYMRGSVCVHIQDLLDWIACMMVVKSILPHAIIWRFQLLVADDDPRLIIGWLLQIHSMSVRCMSV